MPKLADLLKQVRSEIADVAQSRERVQESMSALAQTQAKLGQQAETARRFGREDLAQAAMERAYGIGACGQFAKYIRCRDYYGLRLLGGWLWQLGVRRVGAGLLGES